MVAALLGSDCLNPRVGVGLGLGGSMLGSLMSNHS